MGTIPLLLVLLVQDACAALLGRSPGTPTSSSHIPICGVEQPWHGMHAARTCTGGACNDPVSLAKGPLDKNTTSVHIVRQHISWEQKRA